MPHSILVVEDDPSIADNLEDLLSAAGYAVRVAHEGWSALFEASVAVPDLVILDLSLPDMPGEQVLKSIRERASLPVIVLTAQDAPARHFGALYEGASAFLSKPYRDAELLSCVRAHLGEARETRLELGPLSFDLTARRACCRGKDLLLIGTEFDLLLALARFPGRILSCEELAARVHLNSTPGTLHLIEVQLRGLRELLQKTGEGRLLRSVRQLGFALDPAALTAERHLSGGDTPPN